MLGHATEKLTPASYGRLFKYQVRVSQAVLIVSLILLVTGPVLSVNYTGIHGRIMISGLVLFYLSVMYSQHTGFTRFMPSRLVSLVIGILAVSWSLAYILNQWAWRILLIAWVLLYVLVFVERGLGKIPLFYPNAFTVIGLLSALTVILTNNPLSLLGFPLSSLTSLMRRVEDRRRPSYLDLGFFTMPILMYFINHSYSVALLALFGLMTLGIPSSLPKRTGLSVAYPVGAVLGRFGLAVSLAVSIYATPLDALHMVLIGYIAVMMSSLCIPMLIPGYLWLWPRGYGFEIPVLIEGAALLRLIYPYTGSWVIYVSLVLLYAAFIDILIHYAAGRRIHVEI
ncbi:hypothetical protein [Caldivirga maquilingensis]|uniref:Uncharacterized protein n=1 Tax=Caldivirga maquilingensis (strain ATCC 700844 / DSM 13496 / JCM 10307 / IC-167) TaxID=397948 RepID=A8MAM9_CALMQ|nr:hypothetical protein [Caldivirga maquilingensis]ABW01065.1 hypothetical protein Cmaq_0216 [Caldivirga maquilingensis IC-167]